MDPPASPERPLSGVRVLLDVEDRAQSEHMRRWIEAAGGTVLAGALAGAGAPPLVVCGLPGARELVVLHEGHLRLNLAPPLREADFVRALAGLGVSATRAAAAVAPLDAAKLAEWVGGNAGAVRQLLIDFLRINGPCLGELGQAVAAADAAAIRKLAHRLKGSAGMVGAAPLSQAALALEEAARGGGELTPRFEALVGAYRGLESHLRAEYRITTAEAP